MTAPSQASGPFQSENATVRGYLDEAMKAFAPKVKSIADEAGRKSAVEGYLRDLMPEVEKRGGKMAGIQGENATVDGRIIDFFRDIEGAADPQYLDKTDEVNGGGMGGGQFMGSGEPAFGGALLDDALTGDPLAKIQQLIAQMGGTRPNLSALLQSFGGQ